MGLREDIEKVESKMKEIEEESLAMEFVRDYRKTNQRLFVIWIITFLALVGMCCYTVYLLNDLSNVETTEITQDNKDGYNNYIGNDGDIVNGKTDN